MHDPTTCQVTTLQIMDQRWFLLCAIVDLWYCLCTAQVTAAYRPGLPPVLEDISFSLRGGQVWEPLGMRLT